MNVRSFLLLAVAVAAAAFLGNIAIHRVSGRVSVSIAINQDPSAVFDFMANISNHLLIHPHLSSVDVHSHETIGDDGEETFATVTEMLPINILVVQTSSAISMPLHILSFKTNFTILNDWKLTLYNIITLEGYSIVTVTGQCDNGCTSVLTDELSYSTPRLLSSTVENDYISVHSTLQKNARVLLERSDHRK